MSSILQSSLAVPMAPLHLSFSSSLASESSLFLLPNLSRLSLHTRPLRPITTAPIRMGGGPRTYPGGVTKWQWKRMQAKKNKQLLKARLLRERQIYEMRKRAELKAAVNELERPWEVVERAPNLFSVRADEQVKALADRFQRPGGFDMWTDRDGPQLVRADDEIPSARFFPKGVVHSVKPYARISDSDDFEASSGENGAKMAVQGNGYKRNGKQLRAYLDREEKGADLESSGSRNGQIGKQYSGKLRKKRNGDKFGHSGSNGSSGLSSGQVGFDGRQRGKSPSRGNGNTRFGRKDGLRKRKELNSEVYDMGLQQDGRYGLQAKSDQNSAA